MLFDTHAHLTDEAFDADRDELIQNLLNKPMSGIINCGCDIESSDEVVKLAHRYPNIYAAVGIHPEDCAQYNDEVEAKFETYLTDCKVLAVGEIGLDYHYDTTYKDLQREVFIKQIALAKKMDKPFIIHSRDASKDTYDVLKENLSCKRGAVLHSYSQSVEMLKLYLDLGVYVSFSGVVTFKNAKNLLEVVKATPSDRFFIETDSPYLTPVPFRGKRNNPGYVEYTAKKIAQIRNVDYEQVVRQSEENAKRFFQIK